MGSPFLKLGGCAVNQAHVRSHAFVQLSKTYLHLLQQACAMICLGTRFVQQRFQWPQQTVLRKQRRNSKLSQTCGRESMSCMRLPTNNFKVQPVPALACIEILLRRPRRIVVPDVAEMQSSKSMSKPCLPVFNFRLSIVVETSRLLHR